MNVAASQSAPVVPVDRFSHGTLETRSVDKIRPFLRDFLGLEGVRVAPEALYVYRGGPWLLVCVEVGDALEPQGRENRWGLAVATAEEVDAAHEAAIRDTNLYELRHVGSVATDGDRRSFAIHDRDGNWWEIYHRHDPVFGDLFS
jgi:catechol 2,3-dioxygenase-like lactoylglutathione lyase family enzyme